MIKTINLKLHLGCGHRNLPGFIHIDIDRYPHLDFVKDISNLGMFSDNCAEIIYASHVFIYFDLNDAKKILKEWKRVLIPGGNLKIAVVDFEIIADIYSKNRNLEPLMGYLTGREIVKNKLMYAKSIYDYKLLEKTLKEAGFIDIKKYNWKDFLPKGYHDSSQANYFLDPQNNREISLNIECTKPS